MKKLLLALVAAGAAANVVKKIKSGQREQELWAEATDKVHKA